VLDPVSVGWTAFELEQWQSEFEQQVDINLADSGVAPVSVAELLGGDLGGLSDHLLHYPEVNGTRALRERIAALYPDCAPEQVLVTVGAAEANSLVVQTLLHADETAVVMQPGYQQVRGLAGNLGAAVRDFPLREADGWRPDLDALAAAVDRNVRLVSINTPNNPTGTVLTDAELSTVVAVADRAGAWLHSDEVYRGAELAGPEAPTAWGRAERVVVVGSLSKAYGLSGLRIGWVVAPEHLVQQLWRRHEYATIAAASLSMALGEAALTEPVRGRLLERQRGLARTGRAALLGWVHAHPDLVTLTPPVATALGFPRVLRHDDSVAVATAIKDRAGVLVCPGRYFGAEGHLRISHALDPARTQQALDRIAEALSSLGRDQR
jgi:aspartate/methionine/tyrosine aminotransferase